MPGVYTAIFKTKHTIFKITIFRFQMVVPELVINIYDDDRFDIPPTKSELLESITYVIYTLTPDNFTSTPELHIGNITSNHSR